MYTRTADFRGNNHCFLPQFPLPCQLPTFAGPDLFRDPHFRQNPAGHITPKLRPNEEDSEKLRSLPPGATLRTSLHASRFASLGETKSASFPLKVRCLGGVAGPEMGYNKQIVPCSWMRYAHDYSPEFWELRIG